MSEILFYHFSTCKNSNHPLHALFSISKIEVGTQQCCTVAIGPVPALGPHTVWFGFLWDYWCWYLFIYLFIIHLLIYSFIYFLNNLLIHSFIYLFIYLFIYSFIHIYLLSFLFLSRKPNATCPLSYHFFI